MMGVLRSGPPSPEELFSFIDVDRLVKRTVQLVQLPSVNPFDGPGDETTGERAVAEYLGRHLERLGYQTELNEVAPGRPNVIGISAENAVSGPTVLLAGHTDTVGTTGHQDPFGATVVDGRILGRGTCDMKGALAVFLEVAEVLCEANVELTGRLAIAGLADEEHGMIGSQTVGAAGVIADFAIVGEPTELEVCIAHKGQYAFPIRTFGTAVHSSIADQGVNAIESMVAVVSTMVEYDQRLRAAASHPLCGTGTVNVGTITGGEMVSIVPDSCEIQVDRRVLPGETTAEIRREVSDLLTERSAGSPTMRWEIGEAIIDAAPLDTPPDSPVVRAALNAMDRSAQTGQASVRDGAEQKAAATAGSFTGATDAPNLGVPAVIWGPGSLSLAHTTAESIAVDELVAATRVYLDAVVSLIGRGG